MSKLTIVKNTNALNISHLSTFNCFKIGVFLCQILVLSLCISSVRRCKVIRYVSTRVLAHTEDNLDTPPLKITDMATKKTASDYGCKSESRLSQIQSAIESVITPETEKYIAAEKNRALDASEEYQAAKAQLEKVRAAVLRPVTNKMYAEKIAAAMWKNAGFDSKDTLAGLLCDQNGNMYKGGKSVAVDTIRKAASFYAEWEKATVKTIRTIVSEEEKAYKDFIGAMGVGIFSVDECINRAGELHGFDREQMDVIINKFEAKEKAEEAKKKESK